jgi:hypothetical protein
MYCNVFYYVFILISAEPIVGDESTAAPMEVDSKESDIEETVDEVKEEKEENPLSESEFEGMALSISYCLLILFVFHVLCWLEQS